MQSRSYTILQLHIAAPVHHAAATATNAAAAAAAVHVRPPPRLINTFLCIHLAAEPRETDTLRRRQFLADRGQCGECVSAPVLDQCALAAVALQTAAFQTTSVDRDLRRHHLHQLGGAMFSLSRFICLFTLLSESFPIATCQSHCVVCM